MKKLFFYVFVLALLTTGCTSKEQDEQIKAYWTEQVKNLNPVVAAALTQATHPKGAPHHLDADKLFPPTEENTEEQVKTQQEPEQVATAQSANSTPTQPTKAAAPANLPKVMLFLSPTCPWCQRLQKEGWAKEFRRKYQGKVELIEYDTSTQRGQQALMKQLQKHNLTQVGTPVLFVGNSVIKGYPLGDRADKDVQKLIDNHVYGKQKPYMQIVMEETPKNVKNTKASAQDQKSMQAEFARVQNNNTKTLNDIKKMFGSETEMQALEIIRGTERTLKNKMATSPSYEAYQKAQTNALKAQEKKLNDLMQRNAGSLRSI